MTPFQASCVAVDGKGMLITGQPGTGKSSLALSLIDRGAVLVGDDSLMLETGPDGLIASPHPHTTGLLEVRNLGLIAFPVAERVPLCLIIALDANAERFIEAAESELIIGHALPLIRLKPHDPLAAIKAELALQTYGK